MTGNARMVAVGGGLYERTKADGSRYWVYRWRDRGTRKLRDKGIGPAEKITKTQAARLAKKYAAQVADGRDPIAEAHAALQARRIEAAKVATFGDCCNRFIESHRAGWRNAKHAQQWANTLDTYCAPLLPLPVATIDTALVLRCIEPEWATKTETMTRVRQRMENVLDWATARGLRTAPNPALWRGHLDKLLPNPARVKHVVHRKALAHAELGDFMEKLRAVDTLSARALELQILCASRPGEVAGAEWQEIDLQHALWTIPPERIKAKREHRVPLSDRAVAILKALPRIAGCAYVFPGARRGGHLTIEAMMKTLHTLNADVDAHGFRSTFRDWCSECTAYSREAVERSLAHTVRNSTEAAYFRSDLFDKRRRLLADWARYCATPSPADNVVAIRHGGAA